MSAFEDLIPGQKLSPEDRAQMMQESGGNVNALGPLRHGERAAGAWQIEPSTARQPGYGVTPLQGWDGKDPRTATLEEQTRFHNDYQAAMDREFGSHAGGLAAYNAGPGRMGDVVAGRASMPAETSNYVSKITGSPLNLQGASVNLANAFTGGGAEGPPAPLPDLYKTIQPSSDFMPPPVNTQVNTPPAPRTGAFDDLIPQAPAAGGSQRTGAFDDLIPAAGPAAETGLPQASIPPISSVDYGTDFGPPAPAPESPGLLENIGVGLHNMGAEQNIKDPLGRGFNELQQIGNLESLFTGHSTPGEAAHDIAGNVADAQKYPVDPRVAQGTREIQVGLKASGAAHSGLPGIAGVIADAMPAVVAIANNPRAIINSAVESAVPSIPPLVGGAAGGLAGLFTGPAALEASPILAAEGVGIGSHIVDKNSTMLDLLQAKGVNMADPAAVEKALRDPALMAEIDAAASKHALPVGLMDAASMGAGGRLAGPIVKAGGGHALAGAAETAMQAGLGATGEAAGQINQSGKITDPSSVLMEATGEIVPGAAESAMGAAFGHKANEAVAKGKEIPPAPPAAAGRPSPVEQPPVVPQQAPAVPSQPAPPQAAAVPQPKTTATPAAEPAQPVTQQAAQAPAEPNTGPVTPAASTPEPAPAPQSGGAGNAGEVTTPTNSMKIQTTPEVVDLSQLHTSDMKGYPADRQPRDRNSKRSDAQINEIVSNFDPQRLGDSRTSDQGAPIVGPETNNFVESGNGRAMALRQIYNNPENSDKAAAYREFLMAQGHNINNIAQPVLVRRRSTALEPDQLARFVEDSNRDSKMQQNETELAQQDARRITPDIISLYKGGSLQAEANSQFRTNMIDKVIGSEAEAAGLRDKKGNLSQAGERRLRAAMFAYAYRSPSEVENFYTSADPDMKGIGDVMQDVAPLYAQVRSNIEARGLPAEYDIAKPLTDALAIIRNRKETGLSMAEHLNQGDMLGERNVTPMVEKIIRGLYNKDLTRPASKKAADNFLRGYADRVKDFNPNQGDLMGAGLEKPEKILDQLLKARDSRETAAAKQPALMDEPPAKSRKLPPMPAEWSPEKRRQANAYALKKAYEESPVEGAHVALAPGFSGDDVEVQFLVSHKTLAGMEALDRLTELADEMGINLVGAIATKKGDKAKRATLLKYYQRFGFKEEIPGGLIRREAQTAPAAEAAPLEDSRRYPRSGYARSTDPNELAKTSGRDFSGFSHNDQLNIRKNVLADLGLNVDVAVNMPPERLLNTIVGAMQDRFGMKIAVGPKIDRKLAIDHLSDMYVALQMMAHKLNLPPSAIGLRGTLTLHLEGNRPYLGVFDPSDSSIGIPNKSNSFAHEWFHSLDHFLLEKFGGAGGLYSHVIRQQGVGVNPTDLQGAFANLLNATFFDKDELAAKVLELQDKAQNGKTEKVRKEAAATLKEIEAGNYRGIKGKTDYFAKAKELGGGNYAYWTKPEEMLARAYEAYIASKIDMGNGETAGISKENIGYLSNADERLAKSFPKLDERQRIFDAFDHLFARLREAEILGDKTAAAETLPNMGLSVLDPTKWAFEPADPTLKNLPFFKRIAKRQNDAFTQFWTQQGEAFRKLRNTPIAETTERLRTSARWLGNTLISADREALHSLERKTSSAALRQANDRLFTRPGEATAVSDNYSSEIKKISAYKSFVANIMTNFNVKAMSDEDVAQIRNVMQSRPIDANYTGNRQLAEKVAAQLRGVLDKVYLELKHAGVNIGYLKNAGYLTRNYLTDKILKNAEDFHEKATEVYGIQFDNATGGPEKVAADPAEFMAILKAVERKDDQFAADPNSVKELRKLLEDKADNKPVDEERIKELIREIYPEVRAGYGRLAATEWLNAMQHSNENLFDNATPFSEFTKKRILPPEADVLLKDYMETDPFAIVQGYIDKAAHRVAYQNVMNPKGAPSMEQLYKKMRGEGVSDQELAIVKQRYESLMNMHDRGAIAAATAPVLSAIHAYGTVALLRLATFSSIPEALTVSVKTKNVTDAARVVMYQIDQALRPLTGNTTAQQVRDMTRWMGVVRDDMTAQSIASRMGGNDEYGPKTNKMLTRFFALTGLTGLTNNQREAVLRLSWRYFNRMAEEHGAGDKNHRYIADELAEWGIPKDQTAAWLKWVASFDGQLPDYKEITTTPYGNMLSFAMREFNKQVIQEPDPSDRPYASRSPIGAFIYSVSSFQYAFYENVIKAEGKKIAREFNEGGASGATLQSLRLAKSVIPLMIGTFLTQALRVALTDPDRWDEWKKEGKLLPQLLNRMLYNTNFLHPFLNMLYNMVTGTQYNRDPATQLVGAHLSTYLDALSKFFKASDVMNKLGLSDKHSNSPKNETAEYNAWKAFFRTVVTPTLAIALTSFTPGGPIMSPLVGAAIMGTGSSNAAGKAAEAITGPPPKKGTKQNGDKEPAPKEPKEK